MSKIVLIESNRIDQPFTIRHFIRETDKSVYFIRLHHVGNHDEHDIEYCRKTSVLGIFDESRLEEFTLQIKECEDIHKSLLAKIKEHRKNLGAK